MTDKQGLKQHPTAQLAQHPEQQDSDPSGEASVQPSPGQGLTQAFRQELQRVMATADCLFSPEEIDQALIVVAEQITTRLSDSNPVLLCVMNGGLVLTGQLAPKLSFPLQLDYLHATRYREKLSGSDLHWRALPATALSGRTVLILDDILDEGETLAAVVEWCQAEGAKEVMTAVLVDKQHDRKSAWLTRADFTALVAEDRYLFGYGMDYKGYWRNAPGIFAVAD